MHMRATQHFHRGLPLGTTQQNKRKRNSEKHTEIFLEFLVFLNEQIKGKSKTRKTIYRGMLPTSERRTGNLFGFYFNITTKHA